MTSYSLSRVSDCAGCAAKLAPGELAALLGNLKAEKDPRLIIGFESSDDAAVYKLTEDVAFVSTVDFFPPVVDDPYSYGAIAAANALSDIYAMGAEPLVALNIMAVPEDMPKDIVSEILRGGFEKVLEAKASLAGGHSIYDREPKYGLCVQGKVNPKELLTNGGARPGDCLILTKPLGVGPLVTADKAGLCKKEELAGALRSMMTLNRYAQEICFRVCGRDRKSLHALTDVTGFGLAGHCLEMIEASSKESGKPLVAEIQLTRLNILPGAIAAAKIGLIPAGMYRNKKHSEKFISFSGTVAQSLQDLVFCPETSGGLLISVSSDKAEELLAELKNGVHTKDSALIGEIKEQNAEHISCINFIGADGNV